MTQTQETVELLFSNPQEFGDELTENVAGEALWKIEDTILGYGRWDGTQSEDALIVEVEFECSELGLTSVQTQQIITQI